VATPAETVMKPALGISLPSSSAMSRSQQVRAPRRRVEGMRTATSSAPVRPITSDSRVRLRRRSATAMRAASPAAGPRRALSERKPSMSTSASEAGCSARAAWARIASASPQNASNGQDAGAGIGAGAVGHLGLEALEPRAGIGQRTAQLMTIAPQQHHRVIGRL
jgi:hypothetical protein